MTYTPTVVECALNEGHDPNRDQIVLTPNELRDAHRIAVQDPKTAMTYLAKCEADGYEPHPRTREKYLEAARFLLENRDYLLPVYDPPKPEPTVTARTTERVLPAIQTDECGNRYLEAADSSYRFTFVENPDDGEPYTEFRPRVIPDADDEMDEAAFAVFAADAERFAREITRALPSSWNRGAA